MAKKSQITSYWKNKIFDTNVWIYKRMWMENLETIKKRQTFFVDDEECQGLTALEILK